MVPFEHIHHFEIMQDVRTSSWFINNFKIKKAVYFNASYLYSVVLRDLKVFDFYYPPRYLSLLSLLPLIQDGLHCQLL